MIHTQRWTPDTCVSPADACVFLETWDDSVPDTARVHTFLTRERTCTRHAALAAATAYANNYDENRRKNTTWLIATTVKFGIQLSAYTWSFDATGLLTVSIAGFTTAQKTQLQSSCDVQFGPGKVLVQ